MQNNSGLLAVDIERHVYADSSASGCSLDQVSMLLCTHSNGLLFISNERDWHVKKICDCFGTVLCFSRAIFACGGRSRDDFFLFTSSCCLCIVYHLDLKV